MEWKSYDARAWEGYPALQRYMRWKAEEQARAWRDYVTENGCHRPYVAKGEEIEGLACVYGVIDGERDRYHAGLDLLR